MKQWMAAIHLAPTGEAPRADSKTIREEPPRTFRGDKLDLEIEVPSQSAVSLTVK